MGENVKKFLKSRILKGIIITIIIFVVVVIFIVGGVYLVYGDEYLKTSEESKKYTKGGSITSSGITTQTTAKEVWDNLGSVQDYCTAEELEYLMNAEIVTQYPYIDNIEEGSLNGIVKFYRDINEDGNLSDDERIIYIDSNQFETKKKDYENSGNEDIFKYFTLDGENIKVAYGTKETRKVTTNDIQVDKDTIENYDSEIDNTYNLTNSSSGQDVYTSIKYSIDEKSIPYATLVSQYTMPFDLLAAILVTTENIEFTTKIAELAYNSEINIAIYDNIEFLKETNTYNYDKSVKIDTIAEVNIETNSSESITYPSKAYWVDQNSEFRNKLLLNNGELADSTINEQDQNPYYAYVDTLTKNNNNLEVTLKDNSENTNSFTTIYNYEKETITLTVGVQKSSSWITKTETEFIKTLNESEQQENYTRLNDEEEYQQIYEETPDVTNTDNISVQNANDLLTYAENFVNDRLQIANSENEQSIRAEIRSNINENILLRCMSEYFDGISVSTSTRLINFDLKYILNRIPSQYYTSLDGIDVSTEENLGPNGIITDKVNEILESLGINSDEDKRDAYEEILQNYITKRMESSQTSITSNNITNIISTTSIKNVKINYESINNQTSTSHTESTPVVTENTDNFVNIFNDSKYSTASKWMQDYSSWFFEYLEDSDDTKDMVDLMKYLMYKATEDESFNTKDFSFDKYYSSLNKAGTIISGNSIAETIWFTLKDYGISDYSIAAVLGNLYGESGIISNNMQDSYEIGRKA